MAIIDRNWFLVYTKPKQEKVALENLSRQSYQCYLPYLRVRRRQQQNYRWMNEPMFPRYLFISLSDQVDNWGPIRSTKGVVSLVRFGIEPARVPSVLIDLLKERELTLLAEDSTGFTSFKQGQKVRVLEGILEGYEGIFEETLGSKRVSLLLKIAGKYNKVQVPIDYVGSKD